MLYGTVDADGKPWASILEGELAFAHSPEPGMLHFSRLPGADDPAQLSDGAAIGLLGIELHTRRRNRINGRIHSITAGGLEVTVEQSFGNCPQYIQLRQFRSVPLADPLTRIAQHLDGLDDGARAMIAGADTFFVASYVDVDGQRSVDVSHRGGQSGFVQVEGNRLTIPDFAGNLFFNTLGNLLLNPRAGLLFIDFNSGDLLQLSGHTEIILEGPQIEAFQGAERLWTFDVESGPSTGIAGFALALRWRFAHQFADRHLGAGQGSLASPGTGRSMAAAAGDADRSGKSHHSLDLSAARRWCRIPGVSGRAAFAAAIQYWLARCISAPTACRARRPMIFCASA